MFLKNPRLSALLEYLCERCFEGEAESIKEFNIAIDVFDRPADFDQSQDAIVRVEMHRLRKKLAEFYATEGQQQPVEIVIQSGHYLPEFVVRQVEGAAAVEAFADSARNGIKEIDEAPPGGLASRKRIWLVAGLMAAAVAAIVITRVDWRGSPSEKRLHAADPNATELPVASGLPNQGVHILCGLSTSSWRDRQGNVWGADAFFSGGTAVDLPEQPVYRTRDSFLFRHMRMGDFSYKIPLSPGIYEMRLYFADPWYTPGVELEGGENIRVFNVTLNSYSLLLHNFDIIADAGPNTADVRVFKDVQPASDGYLHLSFAGNGGPPLINAIEIVPGIPHRLRSIRLVTQGSAFTDRSGVTWSRDNYFLSGRNIARTFTVTGTDDPEIYARERYGNFSYAIPVSEGRYRVTLHFAESYWGPISPGGGGVGTRIFDVYCNGIALLRNFDMLKEAGQHTQIVKTFHNLQSNAQGKLLLSFVPVKNYANVSAIEVDDESDTHE